VPPPFWAFLWPGSQALARLLFDQPELVRDKRVFDFGAGCGLAGIAAARVGASRVTACDLDPLAAASERINAELNGVTIATLTRDATRMRIKDVDVVLAGDVCYERAVAREVTVWLRQLARTGLLVLLADPGRAYAPRDGLIELASYEIPTSRELESSDVLHTVVWQITWIG
jgi:predicted nicotinamide N-methyase